MLAQEINGSFKNNTPISPVLKTTKVRENPEEKKLKKELLKKEEDLRLEDAKKIVEAKRLEGEAKEARKKEIAAKAAETRRLNKEKEAKIKEENKKIFEEVAKIQEENDMKKREVKKKLPSIVTPSPEARRKEPSPTTKNSKKSIPKAVRKAVWDQHIGKELGIGMCFCCKRTEISAMSFQCGHVIAESKGGDASIENLRPVCSLCNTSMSSRNMLEFMDEYKF
jgi:5-methylcytosine-specific restriction endonuclease McrA